MKSCVFCDNEEAMVLCARAKTTESRTIIVSSNSAVPVEGAYGVEYLKKYAWLDFLQRLQFVLSLLLFSTKACYTQYR